MPGTLAAGAQASGRSDGAADVCDYDPGFEVTATVETTLPTMVAVWRADRSWPDAIRAGDVVVEGLSDVRRALPAWLGHMTFGAVPRPA